MTKTVKVFEIGSFFSDIIMENTPQNIVCGNENADFGVIMPGCDEQGTGHFGILLLPGNAKKSCSADAVVTYGMAPSDTVTLSSVGEDRCVMTIQSDIYTLDNVLIEPQDIVIPRMHLAPDQVLGCFAALIIAGADISRVFGISEGNETYIS